MRHRSAPPIDYARTQAGYDEHTPRPGQSAGGWIFRTRPRSAVPPEYAQYPPTTQDGRVYRHRGPWFHTGNYRPLADPVRWTDAGPIRPAMHQHTYQWRRGSGGAHSERTGWHTNVPESAQRPTVRTRGQRRPHLNRRTVQPYRGQSYSETTDVIRPR